MKERRRLARFSLQLSARAAVVGGEEAREFNTRDISADGVFLIAERPESEGTVIVLEMELPMDKYRKLFRARRQVRLKIQGVVVRREEGGMAIRFARKYDISDIA